MAMMHSNLLAYYERIFAMTQYHKWSIDDLGELIPWEMDVMIQLLQNYIDKVEMDRKQAKLNAESMR